MTNTSGNDDKIREHAQNKLMNSALAAYNKSYRVTPISLEGLPRPFKKGQNYQPDKRNKHWQGASYFGLVLDDVILVDFDGNKAAKEGDPMMTVDDLANLLGLSQMPAPVQFNDAGTSLHWLFAIPEDIDLNDLRHSLDDAFPYIDIKCKNQLMHVKPHKTLKLPAVESLEWAPRALLELLKATAPNDRINAGKSPVGEVREILSYVDPDAGSREDWYRTLSGIKSALGDTDEGLDLCDEWSRGDVYTGKNKHPSLYRGFDDIKTRFDSFDEDTGVNFSTVCYTAKQNGADLSAIAHKHRPTPAIAWPHTNKSGTPKATLENFVQLMSAYKIAAKYNIVSKDVEVDLPISDYHTDDQANSQLMHIRSLAHRHDFPSQYIKGLLGAVAGTHSYDPFKDWVLAKDWDGKSRLKPLFDTLHVSRNKKLSFTLLKRWLVSVIAATFEEGDPLAHGVLILQGAQGSGKTSWLYGLANRSRSFGLSDYTLNLHDKDSIKEALSHRITELGDIDATFKKADIAHLKAFITRPTDTIRLPYAVEASSFARRTAFCGSVNDTEYLNDRSGNRRFWTITCKGMIDFQHDIDMQQVYAECLALYRDGYEWSLTPSEVAELTEINAGHITVDPIAESIAQCFDFTKLPKYRMAVTEVLASIGIDRPTTLEVKSAGRALRDLLDVDGPRKTGTLRYFLLPAKKRVSGSFSE